MASPRADSLHPATGTDSSHTASGIKVAKEKPEHLTERVTERASPGSGRLRSWAAPWWRASRLRAL
jgi:hypothetical protein